MQIRFLESYLNKTFKIHMADKVVHGYWGVRGAGQISRLLLAYTGAVWEDVKYTSPDQWFGKDKAELGFSFPNLPYLIDGDLKLTETSAIQRYIPKRFGKPQLLGKDLKDEAVVNNLIGVFGDVKSALGPLIWDKEWQAKIEAAVAKIEPKLQLLAAFYGEKEFALGYLTLADFLVADFSYYLEKLSPEVFAKYAFVKRTRVNFEALPEIKKYYEQESAVKGPFVPPSAALAF